MIFLRSEKLRSKKTFQFHYSVCTGTTFKSLKLKTISRRRWLSLFLQNVCKRIFFLLSGPTLPWTSVPFSTFRSHGPGCSRPVGRGRPASPSTAGRVTNKIKFSQTIIKDHCIKVYFLTIKVCMSCSWRSPRNSAPIGESQTVSHCSCSSASNAQGRVVVGPWLLEGTQEN